MSIRTRQQFLVIFYIIICAMATIPEAFAIAMQHHQSGRLQAAEQLYRKILAVEPNHADALHLLGVIAFQAGKHELAIEYIGRAVRVRGDAVYFHNNLGEAYRALHRIPEAVACYRRALELQPDFAVAHYNLGNAFKDEGKLEEAVACWRRALELKPDYAEAHSSLGNALKDQGRLEDAVACWRQALQLNPSYAEAHNDLGNALLDQGKLDEAAACWRRALELKPDLVGSLGSLVHALQHQCRWEDLKVLSQRLIEVIDRDADGGTAFPLSPFVFLVLPAMTTAKQQLRCARQWADRHLNAIRGPAQPGCASGQRIAGRRRPSDICPRTSIPMRPPG